MEYKNKYIKYKRKYNNLQNHMGGMVFTSTPLKIIPNCYDIITFTNKIGICWYLSILIIFIFGDKLGPYVQNILITLDVEKQLNKSIYLLNILLKNVYNKDYLAQLILLIKDKFEIKHDKVINKKIVRKFERQDSYNKSEDIIVLYNTIFGRDEALKGGTFYDSFFFTNILSSILLNKFIKFNKFYINELINIILADNSLGIIITISRTINDDTQYHDCCFFKCNNKLMYSSNSLSIEYNWMQLFYDYNELIKNNIQFKLYINFINDVGPIIITATNEIYNYNISRRSNKKAVQENFRLIQFKTELQNMLLLVKFTILTYYTEQNINMFKVDNNLEYLHYYINHNHNLPIIQELLNLDNYNYNLLYNGETPLLLAYKNNNIDIIKLFLESTKAIDYNIIYNGVTIFSLACFSNNIDIVKLFLESDKEIDYNLSDNGVSPFYYTCSNNNSELIKLLLESDKNINYNLSYNGETPFYRVCSNNNLEIIKLFLESDKHINYDLPYNGITPFFRVCSTNNLEIIKLFLESDKINYDLPYNGETPFYRVCSNNNLEIIKLFLESDKNINYDLPYNGSTAFYNACSIGNIQLVQLLLESEKINYNFPHNNKTPFYIACSKLKIEIVNLLLNSDKDIDYNLTFNNYTPFFIVCANGNVEMCKLFLNSDKNIDYNLMCKKMSPFYIACYNNYIEIIDLFLKSTKDIIYDLAYGKTPFFIACELGYYESVKLFLNSDKNINYNFLYNGISPFFIACALGYYEIVKLFLNSDKNINYNFLYNGMTPLQIARDNNHSEIVELLSS
jgi:ankyrin repeat protein